VKGPLKRSRRERAALAVVMNTIRDGIVRCSADGRILYVNEALCTMTGFAEHELVGAEEPLPYWPDDQVATMRGYIDEVKGAGYGEHELTYRRKDGEHFPAIVSGSLDPTDGSRVIVIKDISDLTELLRRIRDVTTDAETARAAFARSAEVIGEFLYSGELLMDEQLVITATGPGLAALLGGADDASVARYDEYVHPEDWPAYHEEWRFRRLLERDGEVIQHDYRLVGDDGLARWVRDRWRVTVQGGRVFVTGAVRDISSQRRVEEGRARSLRQLEHLSTVDSLTELFNRRHLDGQLEERLARPGSRIAVAMIDVDHFKRINDEYGHGGGDDVLRTVARRLRQATRPHDVVARWGGEEFCVLLGDVADDAHLQALAERLRLAICSDPISVGGGAHIAVAVSVGAARATDAQAEDVLARADAALYRAKETGRNRVIIDGTRSLAEPTDAHAPPLATAR
jgi:diguanylate cyclase (GGDEF)-like protein/PAS domain S-box-containing protein